MAIALSLFIVIGFSRTYYLRFLSDLPPLDTLVHWHSVIFSAWLLVYIAQTRLVAAQRYDLHMKLGIAALGLAVLVVATSFATTAIKATVPRIHPSGLTPPQFTIVGIMSLVLFAGFLALGIAFRRRAAYHKRFMILAMIGVLSPAASRIVMQLGLRSTGRISCPSFQRCSWRRASRTTGASNTSSTRCMPSGAWRSSHPGRCG